MSQPCLPACLPDAVHHKLGPDWRLKRVHPACPRVTAARIARMLCGEPEVPLQREQCRAVDGLKQSKAKQSEGKQTRAKQRNAKQSNATQHTKQHATQRNANQINAKQNKAEQTKPEQNNATQCKATQRKATRKATRNVTQSKPNQRKANQSKAKQSKTKQSKANQRKTKQRVKHSAVVSGCSFPRPHASLYLRAEPVKHLSRHPQHAQPRAHIKKAYLHTLHARCYT